MDYGSHRADRCKHIYAVEYAIRFNTLKEVEHLPEEVHGKRQPTEEKPYYRIQILGRKRIFFLTGGENKNE